MRQSIFLLVVAAAFGNDLPPPGMCEVSTSGEVPVVEHVALAGQPAGYDDLRFSPQLGMSATKRVPEPLGMVKLRRELDHHGRRIESIVWRTSATVRPLPALSAASASASPCSLSLVNAGSSSGSTTYVPGGSSRSSSGRSWPFQWQFYDSPTRAAILAMGLG